MLIYRYCYKIPDSLPLDKAAPLLCAGITVYTPMIRHKMNQPGKALGVRDPSVARHTHIALTKPPEQVGKWAKLSECLGGVIAWTDPADRVIASTAAANFVNIFLLPMFAM